MPLLITIRQGGRKLFRLKKQMNASVDEKSVDDEKIDDNNIIKINV